MPYLGIFRLEFERAIVIFEISAIEFVKGQSFASILLSCHIRVSE